MPILSISLTQLGWTDFFQNQIDSNLPPHQVARVIAEHRDQYILINGQGEQVIGIIPGKWLKKKGERDQLSVGDWVILHSEPSPLKKKHHAYLMEKRLTPYSQIIRKAAGSQQKSQILASNINSAFIVSSCNQELDLKRIERYLSLINEETIKPFLVLNKCDLKGYDDFQWQLQKRFPEIPLFLTRFDQPKSIEPIKEQIKSGSTTVFLGSSGVGKSTLTNLLLGKAHQLVESIREEDAKGRHTTTSRSLMSLPTPYGNIIDTPGLREIQLSQSTHLDDAFSEIANLSLKCRFPDCQHLTEPNCAVKQAVEKGNLSLEKLQHFQKLYQEAKKENSFYPKQRKKQKDS